MGKVEELDRMLKHVWFEPKSKVLMEMMEVSPLLTREPADTIDPDWWEPRHDQPWRRQVARDREEFGGAHVARAKAPVEGPNNPNRLRSELEYAERELWMATARAEEAAEEQTEASERISHLRERLVA